MHLISLPRGANKSPLCRVLPGEACLLTFDMGKEVVSERGVGAGVAVAGAEAAGVQEGHLHTRRQQLCAARIRGRTRCKQKRRAQINTRAGTTPSFQGRKKKIKNVNQESEKGRKRG